MASGVRNLNRRIKKLENQTPTSGDTNPKFESWTSLFAEAREDFDGQILEMDRQAAREFFDACQAAGEKPSFMAMMKLAHQEEISA